GGRRPGAAVPKRNRTGAHDASRLIRRTVQLAGRLHLQADDGHAVIVSRVGLLSRDRGERYRAGRDGGVGVEAKEANAHLILPFRHLVYVGAANFVLRLRDDGVVAEQRPSRLPYSTVLGADGFLVVLRLTLAGQVE